MENFLKIFKVKDSVYNVLKYIALIGLPILGTAWGSLAEIWGLPYGPEIQQTISIISTALGGWLLVSTAQYNKTKSST